MTGSIAKITGQMLGSPSNVRFSDLCKVCEYYFGKPQKKSGSHHVYKTPWQGDPRINIQNDHGKAKVYQIGQVLKAIEKLRSQNGNKS